jgi:hypothetical protein
MAARFDVTRSVGPDGADHTVGQSRELGVVSAGEGHHRHREFMKAIPQRILGTGAALTQARGQTLRSIGEPFGSTRRLARQRREQGPGQPLVEKSLEANIK